MKALALAGVNLRRFIRERSNLFFVFVFPLAIVLVIGLAFGGGGFAPALGVFAEDVGELGDQLVSALAEEVEVVRYDSQGVMVDAVERGQVDAGVVVPAGYDADLRSGQPVELLFTSRPDGGQPQLQALVAAAASDQNTVVTSASFAAAQTGSSFDQLVGQAQSLASSLPGVEVTTTTTGEALFPATLGQFDLGASSQLLLFMFLTGLTGSAAIIQTRRFGVSTRMLSTPTPMSQVVAGEAMGRFAIVFVQGAYIVVATLLLFQVNWGDPIGALAVVVAFALVGAGAGLLMGAVLSNDQQAGGVGVMLGLGLAALGGCMLPLELFSPTLQTVAHFTPHAWGLDAFAELVRNNGTIVDILPELGVLLGFAVVLLSLATWRLRVTLTR
ncbi:MAG TPA: ABC transporter permease [Acidimicrobiia bacterium]|nr:ABC transporter permease [Acidimicrobiia bacterium]